MKTVFFWDIDGTLLTTAKAGLFALEHAYEVTLGRRIALEDLPTAGWTDWTIQRAVLQTHGEPHDDESVRRILRLYEERLPHSLTLRQGRLMPGVLPVLQAIARRTDALNLLLTGNTPAGARIKLKHYGIEGFFSAGVFSEGEFDRNEIARKGLKLAEELLEGPVDLERLFVIGDTPNDIRCGKSIGAKTIGLGAGPFTAAELAAEGAWMTFDVLPEADEFFRKIGLAEAAGSQRD